MAHYLNCENLTVSLPDRVLLDSVSLGVNDGDRIGVVGRNGDGKSTLLKALTGRIEPHDGRVSRTGSCQVGYLTQSDSLPAESTVRQAVVGDLPEHVWAGDPRVRSTLSGLLADIEKTVPEGFDAQIGQLSGGQQRRVALAAVLVHEWDVLILDEPTNHLDVEGVAWLAEHLRGRWQRGKGALLLVTHDRWFLDEVCSHTWEVQGGAVHIREGGYAAYMLARAERDRVEQVTAERSANLVRKELAWLRRGAPARTSKPKFRIDAANALISREPAPRDSVELVKMASARLGKDVFDAENIDYSLPGENGRQLFKAVTWRVGPGDRYGIVGANGAGKSTWLRLLTGDLEPDSGRVKRGKTVQLAVLSQHLRELEAVAESRAVDAVSEIRSYVTVGKDEISAAQLVERLGFTRQRAWTLVKDLSGGERRRLQLARLLVEEPNVLLLDEPTNDLDTDTLTAVEDVLDDFAGTLIVVSHDRYLLERCTDRQIGLFGDGLLRDLTGGVEQYLELKTAREQMSAAVKTRAADAPGSAKPSAGNASPQPKVSGAALRQAQKDAARWERKMEQLGKKIADVDVQMAEAAHDVSKVTELHSERIALQDELDEAEMAWLEASELAGQ